MKIGSEHELHALGSAPAPQARPAREAGAAAPAAGAPAQDRVELSSTGASMSTLGAGTEFDAAKVESIQRAIREGNFHVNAGAIADRLIAEAQAMVGPQTH